MKKYAKGISAAFVALIVFTGISLGATVAVNGVSKVNYQFVINGKSISLPSNYLVLSKNNTTYVPLRFLSEQLGAVVDYKSSTVSISSERTTTMSQPDDLKRIQELEAEVANLKKENEDLVFRLKGINNSAAYKKLPTKQNSINDLEMTLYSITKESNKVKFAVEFVNKSEEGHAFSVDPFMTEIYVNGKKYIPTLDTSASLGSSLNKKDDRLSGYICIDGLDSSKIQGSMTFYFRDNGQTDETVTIFFDNTK